MLKSFSLGTQDMERGEDEAPKADYIYRDVYKREDAEEALKADYIYRDVYKR